MSLKYVNDLPHIVVMQGQHEVATPASQIIATARQRIMDATGMLTSLQQATADAQTNLEAALLAGQPTEPSRAELANIEELTDDQRLELSDAKADIAHVTQLLDQYAAAQITLADQAEIAEAMVNTAAASGGQLGRTASFQVFHVAAFHQDKT